MLSFLRQSTRSGNGPLRWLILVIGFATIASLAMVRISTDAQYAFASLMLLPVLAIAWFAGVAAGWLAAVLAAVSWLAADYLAALERGAWWVPLFNAATRLLTFGIVVTLTGYLRLLLAQEAASAREDSLTGLLNRRGFSELAEREIFLSRRNGQPIAIAFVDLDRFKQLNDSRGHEAGDQALQQVARALRRSLRATDVIGRIGGDEFAVLLVQTAPQGADESARKMRAAVATALADFAPVGVSIGVACFERDPPPLAGMFAEADQAMYEVKVSGRGGISARTRESGPPPGSRPSPRSRL